MNLLQYNKRFENNLNHDETRGYIFAMQDLWTYMLEITGCFSPDKKMIDCTKITDSIADTSQSLAEMLEAKKTELKEVTNKISSVRLSGVKVDDFLKAQLQDDGKNDLQQVNI